MHGLYKSLCGYPKIKLIRGESQCVGQWVWIMNILFTCVLEVTLQLESSFSWKGGMDKSLIQDKRSAIMKYRTVQRLCHFSGIPNCSFILNFSMKNVDLTYLPIFASNNLRTALPASCSTVWNSTLFLLEPGTTERKTWYGARVSCSLVWNVYAGENRIKNRIRNNLRFQNKKRWYGENYETGQKDFLARRYTTCTADLSDRKYALICEQAL